jgi:hypothetical protein
MERKRVTANQENKMPIPLTEQELDHLFQYLDGFMQVHDDVIERFGTRGLIMMGIHQYNRDKRFRPAEYVTQYLTWKEQKDQRNENTSEVFETYNSYQDSSR